MGDMLNDLDYTMILCDSNYNLALERKNIITMLSKGVDGIIISPVNIKSENITLIREKNLKTVYIDFASEFENINYVHVSHEHAGYEAIKNLYSSKQSGNRNIFTAVLSLSDMLAIGVYEASKEIGFNIPDDLSVVGYDNIFMTAYLSPPLTTIHAPKIRTGKLSINILLNQIEGRDKEFHKIILDVRLVERESVKNISNK